MKLLNRTGARRVGQTVELSTRKDLMMVKPAIPPPPVSAVPTVIEHYVASVKDRLHMLIERNRTKAELPTLRVLTVKARLAVEYRNSLDALSLAELEHEVKMAELQQRKREIAVQRHQQERLTAGRLRRDQLALQLEIATLKRQIAEQRKPPKTEATLTPDQQRLLKKREIERELERLRADEAQALKPGMSELEQRRVRNMYASRRDELMEKLEKNL